MIEISVEGDSVAESFSNFMEFIVTLSSPAVDAVTVNYRTLRGTALDFDLDNALTGPSNNGTVTFAPGETSASVFIEAESDSLDERDENIVLELYDPSSNAVFAGGEPVARANGIILDNDGPGSNLALFVSDPILVEGNGGQKNAVFEIQLSQPAPSAFTASYQTVNGTALAGQDYQARSGTVSFASGQQTATVSVPVNGDTVAEMAEYFSLVVTPPSGLSIGTDGAVGEATILDTDTSPQPEISIEGDVVTESFSDFLRFVVTLSEPSFDAVTVNYRTLRDTALDFDLDNAIISSFNNGTVTFAPGETSAEIFIEAESDSLDERDENIVVELFDPSTNAVFAGGEPIMRANGIIRDNNGSGSNLTLFVSDPVLVEGNGGLKNAVFEIQLSQPAPTGFTISYQTANGTALAGQDYQARSGTLSFAPGQEKVYVSVPVIGDTVGEIAEFFSLVVTPPSGLSIGTNGAVGEATILDTDTAPQPEISIEGDVVTENFGNFMRFVVTLSEPAFDAVTVNYRTLRDTALDFDLDDGLTSSSNNGTLTFSPGQTSRSIFIEAESDSLDERDENIVVEIFDPSSNAVLAGGEPIMRANGIILDDDGPGSNLALFVSDPVLVEGDGGQKNAVFEIQLSQPAPIGFTASYQTVNGTALAGQDYQARSGTVSFAPGQKTVSVSVPVTGDTLGETAEYFSLVVTPPSNVSIGTDGAAGVATILDTDTSSVPEISIESDVVTEAFGDFLRFVVTLSEPSVNAITVDYNTVLGTASAADLDNPLAGSENNGTLTFSPGQTSRSVFIEAESDSLDERDESLFIRLTNPNGAEFAGGASSVDAIGFIRDNDGVGLNIALAAADTEVMEAARETTPYEIVVELSQASSAPLVFDVTATNGTAIAGTDYQLFDTTVSFAPGQTKAAVTVAVLGDAVNEGVENFTLTFVPQPGQPFAGAIPDATISIANGPVFLRPTPGNDTLTGTNGNDTIDLLAGNDIYDGLAGNDDIFGNAGNDILTGGPGADILNGGSGFDQARYLGATVGVRADLAFAGTNTGDAAGDTYVSIENLYGSTFNDLLLGTNGSNAIWGDAGNDQLFGRGGNDVLRGGAGRDTLSGDTGADRMEGGAGNDIYIVDNAGDIVDESIAGSTGFDIVRSSVTANFGTANFKGGIEALTLTGGAAINAIGNLLNNVMTGNNASNVINGQGGADNMRGLGGNDTYVVDNAGDFISESLAGSFGFDRVLSSVTMNLSNAAQVSGAIERIELVGAGNINAVGNLIANGIFGNSGNNVINGLGGSDNLTGGGGADSFVFTTALGTGASGNVDTINDFTVGVDRIVLENAIFMGLSTGALSAANFRELSTGPRDANDFILYSAANGTVFYDSDGSGAAAAQLFAVVDPGTALSASDFFIV